MKDWEAFDVLELIKKYREQECLWNHNSDKYKRTDLKKSAWETLASEYGKSVHDIKKKIKYLRNAYVLEKKRVNDSKRMETSEDLIYQPQLYYYDAFRFLDPVIVLRKTVDRSERGCVEKVLKGTADNERESEEANVRLSMEDISSQLQQSATESPSPCPTPSTSTSINFIKARKRKLIAPGTSSNKYRDVFGAIVNLAKNDAEENLYTVFGKNIAFQLQQLTPLQATVAMSEIHQLLSNKIMSSMLSSKRHRTHRHQ